MRTAGTDRIVHRPAVTTVWTPRPVTNSPAAARVSRDTGHHCAKVRMGFSVSLYVRASVRMYVCMYACMYVCMYVCICDALPQKVHKVFFRHFEVLAEMKAREKDL